MIDEVMALRRSLDAVSPVQLCVKPLGRVWGRHLVDEHETGLVEEGMGIGFGGEVAPLPTPISPAAGQAPKNLPGVGLLVGARVAGSRAAALEPFGNSGLGKALGAPRHAGPPKVFLR